MSQSFDDKIKSRLENFQPDLQGGVKKRLFKRMSGQSHSGYSEWQVTGIVLLIIGLLQVFPKYGLETEVSNDSTLSKTTSGIIIDFPQITSQTNPVIEIPQEAGVNTEVNPEPGQPVIRQNQDEPSEEGFALVHLPDLESKTFVNHSGVDLGKKPGLVVFDLKEEEPAPVVDDKSRKYKFYGDAGLFFIYRQGKPNANDELVIENYSGPGRFSPDRLGLFIEAGVHRDIREKIRLNAGLNVSTYQQFYDFSLRNTSPDSVISISESAPVFEPFFSVEEKSVAHRLWVIGMAASADFFVFPSRNNSLFLKGEYQYNLTNRKEVDFNGESYNVYYPNQLLMSFGLRKKIIENRKLNAFLIPNFRYSLTKHSLNERDILTFRPFSAGITLSIQLD